MTLSQITKTRSQWAGVLLGVLLLSGFMWALRWRVSDRRLEGTWRSNRELTVATIPLRPEQSAEKRALFEELFGKLTITYTLLHMETVLPDSTGGPPTLQRMSYRVTKATADTVTVAYEQVGFTFGDSSSKEETSTVMHFEGADRYWIPLGIKGAREYFDRVVR